MHLITSVISSGTFTHRGVVISNSFCCTLPFADGIHSLLVEAGIAPVTGGVVGLEGPNGREEMAEGRKLHKLEPRSAHSFVLP